MNNKLYEKSPPDLLSSIEESEERIKFYFTNLAKNPVIYNTLIEYMRDNLRYLEQDLRRKLKIK